MSAGAAPGVAAGVPAEVADGMAARVAESRSRRRAAGGWVAIGAALVVVGAAAATILGLAQLPARGLLDPEAAGPEGTRAIVEVMRDHGVEVTVARDRAEAESALAAGAATLVVTDTAPLSDDAVTALVAQARDVVLVEPRARDLRLLLGGAMPAGFGDGRSEPECALSEAQRAGPVIPGEVFVAASGDTACYPSGGGHGLLVRAHGDGRIAAVDGAALFTNEHLVEGGNAALAVGLMARHPHVVWYLPTLTDSDLPAGSTTLGELTPGWVTPAITLLVLSGVTAAVWRGRRFGPLVRENLPVTVRAGETTEGRARLYARSGDAAHAADQLRIAALRRLARRLGLGQATSADEIADATAARIGADRATVRDILFTAVPHTDRELVELADRLRDLETATARAIRPESPARPERNTP